MSRIYHHHNDHPNRAGDSTALHPFNPAINTLRGVTSSAIHNSSASIPSLWQDCRKTDTISSSWPSFHTSLTSQ
ncbi:hypothetical protein, partial [Aetokthonos hydrillicola]|uniref:hypothetical protein n=1 Tax=Aetokthonos hydrillicola TaxID=1550245 RepID=UPI0030D9F97E